MGFGLQIVVDTTAARAKLTRVGQRFDEKKYLNLIGVALLYWVDQNFKKEGIEIKWRPLSPNTIAARRKNGRGAKILQDTGRLKMSFIDKYSVYGDQWVQVGSNDPRAEWHHKGTRPYTIRPVRAKMLRFMTTNGWAFAKEIHHPGLPSRPLLPSERAASDIAMKTMNAFVQTVIDEANRT